MSWNPSYKKSDSLEFRQIVLRHIQRILEISSSELRDKTITKNHGTYFETLESEDTRQSYIQAIENLAYVLIPYFDDNTKTVYGRCIKILKGFDYEVKEYCKEEHEIISKQLNKAELGKSFVTEMKLRYAKELFIELNLLLNRNDYLKQGVYGEGVDEIAYGDDVEGEEE